MYRARLSLDDIAQIEPKDSQYRLLKGDTFVPIATLADSDNQAIYEPGLYTSQV